MKRAIFIILPLLLGLAAPLGSDSTAKRGFILAGFDAETSQSAEIYGLGTSDSQPIKQEPATQAEPPAEPG